MRAEMRGGRLPGPSDFPLVAERLAAQRRAHAVIAPARDRCDQRGFESYFLTGALSPFTSLRSKPPLLSAKNKQSEALSQLVVCR